MKDREKTAVFTGIDGPSKGGEGAAPRVEGTVRTWQQAHTSMRATPGAKRMLQIHKGHLVCTWMRERNLGAEAAKEGRLPASDLVRPAPAQDGKRETDPERTKPRSERRSSPSETTEEGRNTVEEFLERIYTSFCKSGARYPELRRRFLQRLDQVEEPQAFLGASLRCLANKNRIVDGNTDPGVLQGKVHTLIHLVLDAVRQQFTKEVENSEKDQDLSPLTYTGGSELRAVAKDLFLGTLNGKIILEPRLVAKLVRYFDLVQEDVLVAVPRERIGGYVQDLLEKQACTPAIILVRCLELSEFLNMETLKVLVESSYQNIALELIGHTKKQTQVEFIQNLLTQGRYKLAWKCVKMLQLEEDFPDVFRLYNISCIRRYSGKGYWEGAVLVAGEDEGLQELVIDEMIAVGELALAKEHCDLFGIEDKIPGDVDLAAMQAKQRAKYLHVDDFRVAVSFVDNLSGVREAVEVLSNADIVGLDVEWKAEVDKQDERGASLLQLSTESHAFVLDAAMLCREESRSWMEINDLLTPLFATSPCMLLGFDLATDLKVLARSFPQMDCFKRVCGSLDLQKVWKRLGPGNELSSLSKLCELHLGKPLDKRVRMSNWERRPLSNSQLHYAALDAQCLIPLYRSLKGLPNFEVVAREIYR